MEIFQIVGLGIVAVILITLVRSRSPEIAIQISLLAGLLIFSLMVVRLASVLRVIGELTSRARIDNLYLNTILKVVGVAYVAGFGSEVCRDAGEGAIATKIEFAGKVIIMIMALPIMVAVLETIARLIP